MDDGTKQALEANWDKVKGKVKEKWGDVTDDDLTRAEGRADKLVGVIKETTGKSEEEIREELDELAVGYGQRRA